jgi:hypothetical protein
VREIPGWWAWPLYEKWRRKVVMMAGSSYAKRRNIDPELRGDLSKSRCRR